MEDSRGGSFCDDILYQIFLRLPIKSTFRFRCLSKTWNSQLSHYSFHKDYKRAMQERSSSSLLPLAGIFRGSPSCVWNLTLLPSKLEFAPFCKEGLDITKSRNFIRKLGYFLGCSNGLLLYGFLPSSTYHVCNPTTHHFVKLPEPHNNICHPVNSLLGFNLYKEENCQNYYIVIRADNCSDHYGRKFLPIETYSSATRVWTEYFLENGVNFNLCPDRPCTAVGGIFYWMARQPDHAPVFIAHDPRSQHRWLWWIRVPRTLGEGYDCTLSEYSSTGGLVLAVNCYFMRKIEVFLLRKKVGDYSPYEDVSENEWKLCFTYNYDMPPGTREGFEYYVFVIGFHPHSCRFILLRIGWTFYWFDIETGKSTVVWCVNPSLEIYSSSFFFSDEPKTLIPYFQPEWPPSP